MALHTREDFCELTGIKSREVSTYISRGKIVLSGELFDDTIPQNAEFIKKRAEIMSKKKGIEQTPPETKPEYKNVSPNYANLKTPKYVPPAPGTEDKTPIIELERAKLILQNIKTTEEIEKLRLHNAKASGESIPTELVKVIFAQHSKSVITSFHNGAENLLIEISKKLGMDRSVLAEFKGVLVKIINDAVDKSITESKKQIGNVVKEYAVKREQGEKEQ